LGLNARGCTMCSCCVRRRLQCAALTSAGSSVFFLPIQIKALRFATEAAVTILRIDESIKMAPKDNPTGNCFSSARCTVSLGLFSACCCQRRCAALALLCWLLLPVLPLRSPVASAVSQAPTTTTTKAAALAAADTTACISSFHIRALRFAAFVPRRRGEGSCFSWCTADA
jgi:hypothetical protein